MKMFLAKLSLLTVVLIVAACGQKSQEQNHDHAPGHEHAHNADSVATSPNEVLYNDVMKIHDEVMPKMNDIYKLKQDLKKEAEAASEAEKKKLEATIAKLDSASENMMVWMREFNPIPDSVDEQKAKAYLEAEMIKVQKVKTDVLEAIDQAKK